MTDILSYLRETYGPVAILLYGSYANGTNDISSDFDCMVIVPEKTIGHDDSVVAGVRLDCFIFTEAEVRTGAPEDFITAYDAEIVQDNGIGAELKQRVRDHVAKNAAVSTEEKQFTASWIRKTLVRVRKNDDEGSYRAIRLLQCSLEDYFHMRDMYYFGSKRAIRYLKDNDACGYTLFHEAITTRTNEAIAAWEEYVIAI